MKIQYAVLLALACAELHAAEVMRETFDGRLDQWRSWSRDANAISTTTSRDGRNNGGGTLKLKHRGQQDWSIEPRKAIETSEGALYEFETWVRLDGDGILTLCASTWNSKGEVQDWSYADKNAQQGRGGQWQHLKSRIYVPAGVVRLQPRIIGYGPIEALVDEFSIRELPRLASRASALPSSMVISNPVLSVTLNTTNGTFAITDRRTSRVWSQTANPGAVLLRDASVHGLSLSMTLFDPQSGLELSAKLELAEREPELLFSIAADGELERPLAYPHPFQGAPGDYLVVPMNEGISYPVDDASVEMHRLIAYGGHGICMAFWGVTDGEAGHMAIIETPDDAAIRMQRRQGLISITPEWEPQKGSFGYARKLRYIFLEDGGHVAIAKRYRRHALSLGLVKKLEDKRRTNPSVDLLIGAVNVWCWDRDAESLVKEMQEAGIKRILWSNRQTPEKLRALNNMGVLTSRYDIYQDVMNPAEFSRLQWIHPDWTTNAWPDDIILNRQGDWIKGWAVEAKDGKMIPCGVICDKQAVHYAKERAPAELESHPYKSRFIDTTTAAPWHECYHPRHPMTRGESRNHKMQLLRYFSEELNLVTGCETGHDASVPFLHYFEGMLSLGPYRVPDAGRRMSVIWTNVPENVAKFQLGEKYRLPLWELVFHDCVVSQWYWGDYNNKLPALWDKRDLFNLLYGTPPMFMFDRKLWAANKERFVQSYLNTCPVVREVGYAEMSGHRFVTKDRTVQETRFATGHTILVNFGSEPFTCADGSVLKPRGFLVRR